MKLIVFTILSFPKLRDSGLGRQTFQCDVKCLSPNYGAREWRTDDVHTGLNSGRRHNRSSLWSNYLHNEGQWERVIGLLQYATNVTGIQSRIITGGLDNVRGLKQSKGALDQLL